MKKIIGVVLVCIGILYAHTASAQWDWLREKIGWGSGELTDARVAAGLKEALRKGIDTTVSTLGKTDGYLGNNLIKLQLPDVVRKAEGLLRTVGFGPQIDEFVLSMNRAAEKATTKAKGVFTDAIAKMTFDDAMSILKGSDTAATDYFKEKTKTTLISEYTPVVEKALNEYGVTKKYQELVARYNALPLAKNYQAPAIEEYVVSKSLDGMFSSIADEERKIRQDPAARTTKLLKDVFKNAGQAEGGEEQ